MPALPGDLSWLRGGRRRTGVHGRGRAWFGIVVGALGTLLMVITLVTWGV